MASLNKRDVAGRCWHAIPAEDVVAALATNPERGLDHREVAQRRQEFGENRLPESPRQTVLSTFLRQFRDPLIYILLIAGAVSLALGHIGDAGFIFAVLLFNAALGSYQEYRSESAAQALQKVIKIVARVTRSGRSGELESAQLVPGDLVSLRSGFAVPADIRLLHAQDLRADESLLTGESTPVRKDAHERLDDDIALGDRATVLHAGTVVLSGRAEGIVAAIADQTELGRIAESLTGEAQVPPLVLRMRRFTRVIAVAVLAVILLLGLAQLLRGIELTQIFFLAVALAVSAIPAGLPVAVTVALAIGSHRMAARNVIVRKLPAVEGLGACTLIGSDKTGTLTENRLSISRVRPLHGADVKVTGTGLELGGKITSDGDNTIELEDVGWLQQLAISGALCNEAELTVKEEEIRTSGDTIDVAFLVMARKLDMSREELLEKHPEIGNIPFESEQRFSASFNRDGDAVVAHVKGAAQTVAGMCRDVDVDTVEQREDALAGDGYRVLAVACGEVDGDGAADGRPEVLKNLAFLGLVGLIDPVRAEVPDAVERCRAAGVEVRMITGDHPATARAIARQLAIAAANDDKAVLTGADIGSDKVAGKEMDRRIRDSRIYARVEPRQKTAIVDSLQRAGHFVAITGDGVNDAPALQAAHIGVAMGASGTDVARRAAGLILTDDNFASIVNGIEEGRIAYDNVRKVIWLLISTGVAELVLFTLSVIFDTPLPLTPVQLLWLNLVTNGIQDVGLAFEKGEPDILERKPRSPDERIFNRLMIEEVLFSGLYMGLVAFAFFYVLIEAWSYDTFEARNLLLLLLVLFENVHAFNVRSETRSAFRIPLSANWLLVSAVIAAQLIHIVSMFIPGWRDLLGIEPVAFSTWVILLVITLSKLLLVEVYKKLRSQKLAGRPKGHYRVRHADERRAATKQEEYGSKS